MHGTDDADVMCSSCLCHSFCMQANPTGDPDHPGLSIAWGACGHVFHLDCIQRWLKTRSACPLCNKEWDFLKIERILAGDTPEHLAMLHLWLQAAVAACLYKEHAVLRSLWVDACIIHHHLCSRRWVHWAGVSAC